MPCWNIHLSEARNEKWNSSQLKDFMDFIDFLMEWTYRIPCQSDKKCFAEAVLLKGGFNILSNPFSTNDRKSDCLTQATIQVILEDLIIVPCHKMAYAPFIEAKFKVRNNKIVGIESNNPEMLIGRNSFKDTAMPHCETCLLKYLCQKDCLGSQLETTGDPFSPIPTVCKLEHAKVYSLIKALKKFDLYNIIYSRLSPNHKHSLDIIKELLLKK